MSRWFVRLILYVVLALNLLIVFSSFRYLLAIKDAPLAVLEPIHGTAVLNGKKVSGPTELTLGKYRIVGECRVKLFGSRVKVVRLQHFEVEIKWEK